MTEPATLLSPSAADRLIAAHDGDAALLYIYIKRSGSQDPEQAAQELGLPLPQVQAALKRLRLLGLLEDGAAPAAERYPRPEERLPEYTAEDLVVQARADPAFGSVVEEATRVFSRKLSSADLKMLFGLYQHLALPPEVLLLLLNYCAELAQLRRPGSRPSPKMVEKEGYAWANREILTLEQAEEHIRTQRARRETAQRVKEVLGIRGRELVASELKYVTSWLEMGFGEEAIAIAYDRTVTNTGSLRWPYLDRILRSWHEKKLHTPEEIEAGDSRRRPGGGKASGKEAEVSLDELNHIYNNI